MKELEGFLDLPTVLAAGRALILVAVGFLVSRTVSRAMQRAAAKRLAAHETQILRRAVSYLVLALFLAAALHQLGFDLGVLLGAAGVLSVAVAFAAQTSASNFISGLFLLAERSFTVGDVIRVGGTTGEVLAIDLLSIKLRTFDNLFVRIPNETLIKTEVTSLTRFPLRRVDIAVGVGYGSDLKQVHRIMREVAVANPLGLQEPEPVVQVLGFGDSSIDFQYSVWGKREKYIELKNTIQDDLKRAFEREGIEIPFPQRVLTGAAPLELRVLSEPDATQAPAEEEQE